MTAGEIAGLHLEAVVGRGNGTVVWRARRLADGRTVAVKRAADPADPAVAARLEAEARVLRQAAHPHVVALVDVVADGDGVALVLEHAAAGTLAGLLARHGPLQAAQVTGLLVPVAGALAHLHARGLVHGDVKPANLLLTADGRLLLADPALPGHHTPGYRDPAATPGRPPAPAADVYALALVAREALGRRPVPLPLSELLAAATHADPAHRPDGAGAFGERLAATVTPEPLDREVLDTLVGSGPADADGGVAAGGPPPQGPPTREHGPRPPRPAPPRRDHLADRRRLLWSASAVFTLATVALGAHALGPTGQPAAAPEPPFPAEQPAAEPPTGCPALPPDPNAGLVGDVDGDGCADLVRRDGHVLTLPDGTRFAAGAATDEPLLADWDCDGAATPGVRRPTGAVYAFAGWATEGAPVVAEPVATVPTCG